MFMMIIMRSGLRTLHSIPSTDLLYLSLISLTTNSLRRKRYLRKFLVDPSKAQCHFLPSVCAFTGKNNPYRLEENEKVKPDRPVLDVIQVLLHPFVVAGLGSA